MTIDAYLNPDFTWMQKLLFFAVGFLGLLACDFLMLGGAEISCSVLPRSERKYAVPVKFHKYIHLFYEMIISGTSVMSFACSYVVLNHVYSLMQSGAGHSGPISGTFFYIWSEGKDFALLLLICLSCVLNTLLDTVIIPLGRLAKEEKASVRMLGMFYAIIILVFLNLIGDESEYSPVMMYYLGLMVGRFVYFDASFMDFLVAIKNAFMKLPMLLLCVALCGGMCFFGFAMKYLLERNYYIVGIFYTHIFLLIAVFVVHHSRIMKLLVKEQKLPEPVEEEEYDEYDEYEDER
ncbi:hypothetical protein [Butyrivibrio sp. FC2001]|uniref:hypothetical protein n=1 Tax=Butyrivibrio sp. FC2001 TaxID=1280671 RepID=UPI0003F99CF3|nr:hypothetical protein [Butyrivibrio sp. FC2001]